MRRRTASWLAWCGWVVFVAIATPALIFQIKNAPSGWLTDAFASLTSLALASVGALIASRRPENPIGWIFGAGALLAVLGSGLAEYTVFALITAPGSLPAGVVLGVVGGPLREAAWFLIVTFPLLLFPHGRLLSPRWRPLAWLIAAILVVWPICTVLSPSYWADTRLAALRNPLEIPLVAGLLNILNLVFGFALSAAVFACIAAVILRFRRARGVERQQLKWVAYGMGVTALLWMVIIGILIFGLIFTPANVGAPLTPALFELAFVFIPVSAGIAILRYHLFFDIDLLINLTLVYGLLSATLLFIYLVLVFGGQYLLSSRFGPNNGLVLVVSTLLVAALFDPLRHRVQQVVDQRFYRSRYDAAKVIEHFGEALRQELDLEQLGSRLLQVVEETVQPAHLSLWLAPTRPPAPSDQAEDKLRSTPEVD